MALLCGAGVKPVSANSLLDLLKKKEDIVSKKSSNKKDIQIYNNSAQDIQDAQPLFMQKQPGMSSGYNKNPTPYSGFLRNSGVRNSGVSSTQLSKLDHDKTLSEAAAYNEKVDKVAELNAKANDEYLDKMRADLDKKIQKALEAQAKGEKFDDSQYKSATLGNNDGADSGSVIKKGSTVIYRKKDDGGMGAAHEPIHIFKNFR